MLIAVIYYADKCPVHDNWTYHGLRWFQDEDELLSWLAAYTKMNFYIKDVWLNDARQKASLEVKYQICQHHYIGVEVFNRQRKIAHIRQYPYGSDQDWDIVKGDCDGVL